MNIAQQKLLEIIIKFDKLCRSHGITYYLGGGSALGAVRHRGFLPWDDDVDLYMTRDNYLKLINKKSEFFSDDFILVNKEEYPGYGNTLVRCVDTHSTGITKARMLDDAPKGQFVEIFVLDPMPNDRETRVDWLRKHWVYTELVATAFRVANPRIDAWIDEDLWVHYQKKVEVQGRVSVLEELEAELFCFDDDEADELCSRWGLRNLIYRTEWFREPRFVPFEGVELPVATCVEEVLRFDYGDSWMVVPDIDDQVTHDFTASNAIPYRFYVEDYMQFVDEEAVLKAYAPRKKALLEQYFAYRQKQGICQGYRELHVQASLEEKSKQFGSPENLLEKMEFQKMRELFSVWERYQFSQDFVPWRRLIRLPGDALKYALISQLMCGFYGRVIMILGWLEESSPLVGGLESLRDFAQAIRCAYVAVDVRDMDSLRRSLLEAEAAGFSLFEQQYDYCYLKLFSRANDNDCLFDEEFLAKARNLVGMSPRRGEALLLLADVEARLGDEESAKLHYEQVLALTRHAFVVRRAHSRIRELEEGVSE